MRKIFEYLGQKIRAKRLNVFVLFLLAVILETIQGGASSRFKSFMGRCPLCFI